MSRISDLIIKYLKEELTVEEGYEFQNWAHSSPENNHLFHQLTEPSTLEQALLELHELKLSIRRKIDARMEEYRQRDQMFITR